MVCASVVLSGLGFGFVVFILFLVITFDFSLVSVKLINVSSDLQVSLMIPALEICRR